MDMNLKIQQQRAASSSLDDAFTTTNCLITTAFYKSTQMDEMPSSSTWDSHQRPKKELYTPANPSHSIRRLKTASQHT